MMRLILVITFFASLLAGVCFSLDFYSVLHNSLKGVGDDLVRPAVIIGVLTALLLQIAGHAIRALKHRLLLNEIREIELKDVFKGQMIGFMFNALLPLRLGELIRAHYIGKGVSISRSAVFATILFERLIDLLAVLIVGMIVLLAAAIGNHGTLAHLNNALAGTAVLTLLLALLLFAIWNQSVLMHRAIYHLTAVFNTEIRDRMRLIVWSFAFSLRNVLTGHVIAHYLLLSVAMWLTYITSVAAIVLSVIEPDILGTAIASIAAYIGVSTPLGPTYVASFTSLYTSSAETFFTNQPLLLVTAFLVWVVLVLPSIVLGLAYILQRQQRNETTSNSILDVMKNKLYRDADISKEFGHFLDTYFAGNKLNLILNNHEVAKNFTIVKTFKGGSNALTLLAWQDDQLIVKKITLPQFADKLSAQYEWLKAHGDLPEITRVLDEQTHKDHYAIDIEYRDEYVTFFDFIHSSNQEAGWRVLKNICTFTEKHIYQRTPITDQLSRVDAYIASKVVDKVIDASNTNIAISQILSHGTIIVNGRKLTNFNQIIEKIRKNKRAMADLATFEESTIHGDLTIDNVIVNPSTQEFLLLDPNNENTISDPVTDYGKLFQSVHSGYEFLVMLTKAGSDGNTITFEENRSVKYDYLYEMLNAYLHQNLPQEQYRSILFHEAVHYCRMLTYRASINPETAILFYGIAIRLFNDFLEQYDS